LGGEGKPIRLKRVVKIVFPVRFWNDLPVNTQYFGLVYSTFLTNEPIGILPVADVAGISGVAFFICNGGYIFEAITLELIHAMVVIPLKTSLCNHPPTGILHSLFFQDCLD
jgi:hypothetical protein